MRREVDEAMRETTSALSRITDLLALATAPPARTARIHRVEVLQLQPRVAMVVVIASNGAVTKRVFTFEAPLDPGLIEWASSYLNERLGGLALGARMIADRLGDPELGESEAASSARSRAPSPTSSTAPSETSTSTARRACSPRSTSTTCRTSTR